MSKYLVSASYTADGMRGVIDKGGTSRRDAVEKMVVNLGGRIESFNFAFGAQDVYVVLELPDNVSAAALGMAVAASGLVKLQTTVLLTPDEVDRASHTPVSYTPPGS